MGKTEETFWTGIIIFLCTLVVAILVWGGSHPTTEETKTCIRAGYDRAIYPAVFSFDGYCQKDVKFSLVFGDGK